MDEVTIAGEFVTEKFQYDGGRHVTVYVPPEKPALIVYAGDGQRISQWGRLLESAGIVNTMIVGVHGLADEMGRIHEYSPIFDANKFSAHEEFFVGDVRKWVLSRFGVGLPADRTAVFGVSAGGELSLALGLRHPDVFGVVFSASPGAGFKPTDQLPSSLPRVYLMAGTLEQFFLENAMRWADALGAAGDDVVMSEKIGSHGDALWQAKFPLMVKWALGQ